MLVAMDAEAERRVSTAMTAGMRRFPTGGRFVVRITVRFLSALSRRGIVERSSLFADRMCSHTIVPWSERGGNPEMYVS
jgi:hypothetical protein